MYLFFYHSLFFLLELGLRDIWTFDCNTKKKKAKIETSIEVRYLNPNLNWGMYPGMDYISHHVLKDECKTAQMKQVLKEDLCTQIFILKGNYEDIFCVLWIPNNTCGIIEITVGKKKDQTIWIYYSSHFLLLNCSIILTYLKGFWDDQMRKCAWVKLFFCLSGSIGWIFALAHLLKNYSLSSYYVKGPALMFSDSSINRINKTLAHLVYVLEIGIFSLVLAGSPYLFMRLQQRFSVYSFNTCKNQGHTGSSILWFSIAFPQTTDRIWNNFPFK